jgi:hypothetical protein
MALLAFRNLFLIMVNLCVMGFCIRSVCKYPPAVGYQTEGLNNKARNKEHEPHLSW